MYCPSELHDNTSVPHDLETMKTVWQNIYKQSTSRNLPFKICFTGGEVTANKNFLPLVQWLRESYKDIQQIVITTNGSASLNYYLKLSELVHSISFSVHSEHMDEQDFFNKSLALNQKMIRPEKSFHVNIMDEYWNQDRIELYKKWLTGHDISHSVNVVNYHHKTREYPIMKGKSNLAV
jgi:organic radical activating enzyme